jgi:hypothetical protein
VDGDGNGGGDGEDDDKRALSAVEATTTKAVVMIATAGVLSGNGLF